MVVIGFQALCPLLQFRRFGFLSVATNCVVHFDPLVLYRDTISFSTCLMLPACTVYTLLFGVLFGFSRSRATGRRAAAEARTGVRTALDGAACLARTRTQTNLARVRTLSLSVFLLLEFYSRLWLFSSIIDHRSSIIA